jgi:hypothetical protein
MPAAAVETSGKDRPPIAAPVSTVNVNALPVVRSQSEVIETLVAGLFPGLMANAPDIEGISFLAVRDDHVIVRQDFGMPQSSMPFDAGTLGDVFSTLAMMQQIEHAKIRATELVAGAGVTLEQVLTHQAVVDPGVMGQEVSHLSGEPYAGYLSQHIFMPLMMTQSGLDDAGLHTSVDDMGRLMIALTNGGAAGEGRVLQPATVDLMERTHFAVHPALPGAAYGFSEMRRNGWRALQHDGEAPGVQTRLVLVPESRFGYFAMVRGHADASFWRALDDALFDQGFTARTPQAGPDIVQGNAPAPGIEAARAAEGVYSASVDTVAPLKTAGTRLRVEAREDGALRLSGIENAVLSPRSGGYWSAATGNLAAVFANGKLMLTSGTYEPLALWLRWDIYLLLALAAGFATTVAVGVEYRGRRAAAAYAPGALVLLGGIASAGLGVAALAMWLFSSV